MCRWCWGIVVFTYKRFPLRSIDQGVLDAEYDTTNLSLRACVLIAIPPYELSGVAASENLPLCYCLNGSAMSSMQNCQLRELNSHCLLQFFCRIRVMMHLRSENGQGRGTDKYEYTINTLSWLELK